MKFSTSFLFILCITVLLSIRANGATWIVSPAGLDSNAGTLNSPWSLNKAILSVNPGDVVYLRGGTYPGYFTLYRNGSLDYRITFQNYAGESPVIDGSGKTSNPANAWDEKKNLINVYGRSITFRGIEFINSAGFAIRVFANYCTIDLCHLHNNYFAGVYLSKCSYGTVTNCMIHDNYDYGAGGTGGGGDADGIGATAGNTQPYPDYGHHLIKNNVIYNASDDGIDMWSTRGNTIENNLVYHTGFGNPGNGGSLPSSWEQLAGNGTGIKSGGEGPGSGQSIMRNNVVYDCVRRGGFDGSGGENNVYYNNTVYNCLNGFIYIGASCVLKNNLAIGCTDASSYNEGASAFNSWNLGITDARFISADPASTYFLQLSADSPAIDAGVELASVTADRIGTLRPQGTGYDLGAYEWCLVTRLNPAEQAMVKVFPNPSTGLITVGLANSSESVISVFDIRGNSILRLRTDKSSETIDLSGYKGILILKVVTDGYEFTRKVVIR